MIELINYGAPLHYIDARFYTPLLVHFWSLFETLPSPDDSEDASISKVSESLYLALIDWLESLQECGVNLEEYGEKEVDLRDQGQVSWSFNTKRNAIVALTYLTYGPLPSDWKVTWVLRDKETPYIPGGWIGDDDSDEEDGSLEDEDEDDPAEDEDEDNSTEEVYEDCSVGDEPEISTQATWTE